MRKKKLRCRLGLHSYPRVPEGKRCRDCSERDHGWDRYA